MVFFGQCQGVFFILSLPKDKINLFGRAGQQVEVQLQDGTRIFTGGDAGFEPQAVQSGWESRRIRRAREIRCGRRSDRELPCWQSGTQLGRRIRRCRDWRPEDIRGSSHILG